MTLTFELKTARHGNCNGCDIDEDLYRMDGERFMREAGARKRIHVKIGNSVSRLCPECAKNLSGMLGYFHSTTEGAK